MKRTFFWGAMVLLLGLMAFGLGRLRLDVEVLNLLPGEVPVVHGLKLYQQHFADSRELILTLNGPSAEVAENAARLCAEALNRATNLVVRAVWQPPWLEHPEHMAELIACLWLNQPPETLAQLTNRLASRLEQELAAAREELATTLSPAEIARLAYDPLGLTRLPESEGAGGFILGQNQDWFSGAEGTFRIVFVEPNTDLANYHRAAAWMAGIKNIIDERRAQSDWPHEVVVGYTGGPPFLAETAARMEHDMKGSSIGTLIIIAGLFWWAHRRLVPLLWQTGLLVLVVLGTMALGGLIFGKLNVISLGFAAILMGLADDYGLILYQEWTAMPDASSAQLRRLLGSSILWSAVSTAAAFGLLNFGGLPGLSQLGSLVAMGILLAAVVMLFAFLPVARKRGGQTSPPVIQTETNLQQKASGQGVGRDPVDRLAWGATAGLAVFIVVVLATGWPRVDHGIQALQLTHCPAQTALDDLQEKMNREGQPMLLVFSGRDEDEVAHALQSVSARLQGWQSNGLVKRFMLPSSMWPHPERQKMNRVILGQVARQREPLRDAVLKAGFTSDAFGLAAEILNHWERFAGRSDTVWPANTSCQWLLKRFAARTEGGWLALGMFNPASEGHFAQWRKEMANLPAGVWLTGWSLLGEGLLEHVRHRQGWLMAAMLAVLAGCLWLAFRRPWEVVLSFLTLGLSGLVLLAIMRLTDWAWNLMNFMALPLLLGVGVDYTIHVQLALRRSGGNTAEMRRITGRALFLAASTTVAGFGSLAWSSSAGLASLGLLCSTGILCVFLISSFLLPEWWKLLAGRKYSYVSPSTKPSGFYRAGLWRGGLVFARVVPDWVIRGLSTLAGELYYRLRKQRVEIVVRNLLPVCGGSRDLAVERAHQVFLNFAVKLVNLWKFESGEPVKNWLTKPDEWGLIRTAQERGRGLLFVTLHLGDWEHGGLLLTQSGIKLMVVTLAEPGNGFTEVRSASRARWGIDTLVIGEDTFAFVEVIKRLQDGGAVAVSIDRPPTRGGAPVEFFGQPFQASNAAAELARASGCAVLGVVVTRSREGIRVRVLPEFVYERQKLGNREARRQFTQEILRAFEPEIRQHVDQWYQFGPIWPNSEAR